MPQLIVHSDDIARVMESVKKERDRAYDDCIDGPCRGRNEFERLTQSSLERRWEHLREEYKTLRLSYYNAKEREAKEAKEKPKSGVA